MKTLCGECGKRAVEPLAVSGRTSPYKNFAALPLPDDLAIPTCANCGAEWIGARDADRIDAALENAAAEALSRLGREAIEALVDSVTQRELEELLGLSPGYVSKVKRGHEVPSASLVADLVLLAVRPHRVAELRHIWSTLRLPPRVTIDHVTSWGEAPPPGGEGVAV